VLEEREVAGTIGMGRNDRRRERRDPAQQQTEQHDAPDERQQERREDRPRDVEEPPPAEPEMRRPRVLLRGPVQLVDVGSDGPCQEPPDHEPDDEDPGDVAIAQGDHAADDRPEPIAILDRNQAGRDEVRYDPVRDSSVMPRSR